VKGTREEGGGTCVSLSLSLSKRKEDKHNKDGEESGDERRGTIQKAIVVDGGLDDTRSRCLKVVCGEAISISVVNNRGLSSG